MNGVKYDFLVEGKDDSGKFTLCVTAVTEKEAKENAMSVLRNAGYSAIEIHTISIARRISY
jgi:hypothetical protein